MFYEFRIMNYELGIQNITVKVKKKKIEGGL